MSDQEAQEVQSTMQQNTSGAQSQNAGTTGSASSFRTPRNLPIPEKMVCQGDLPSNWEFFKQRWTDYEVATGLRNQERQVRLATLRSVMGRDCLQILKNLGLSEEQSRNIDEVLSALEGYFRPQKNVVFERFKFNSAIQSPSETVDSYINNLRHLSSTCDFGSLTDELIRDRLVIGVRDSGLKERLLREQKLTLDKALKLCKASETASEHLKSMSKRVEEVSLLNKLKPRGEKGAKARQARPPTKLTNSRASEKSKKCKFCGLAKKHAKKEDCAAYGKECHFCKKKNHFSSVCKAKIRANSSEKVKVLSEESDTDSESLFKLETLSTLSSKGKKVFASLEFCLADTHKHNYKSQLICQLDTGATCNVISYGDVCALLQTAEPPLRKSTVRLKLFDGSVMKPRGEIDFLVEYRGVRYSLQFQVVSKSNRPLISFESCEKLGLLKLDVDENSVNKVDGVDNSPVTKETVVKDYNDVFHGLGHIGDSMFVLSSEVKPVQHTPCRIPIALQDKVKAKLAELEKRGIIKKVTVPTEWISSMVIVAKPNGKIRICLDPRDLNQAIMRPKYQMPTLEEILPRLAKAKVFSTLDAKDGFYQIALDKESSLKTTFWTPFGRFRYLRMPFGVNLAPEEFECKLHEKLDDLPGVMVLRDDILVVGYGETQEEAEANHDDNLKRLLDRARQVKLKLNKDKLNLRKTEVQYMGHVITKHGLRPDPAKVSAIQEMPKPTSKKELMTLLGFVSYLAKFLPRLSEVVKPLRDLTTKNAQFLWSHQHDKAFQEVKELVVQYPVLKFYNPEEEATLQCDASESGLGAALLQNGQPVAFTSRTLTATQKNYAQIEKECLAIVFGCQHFHQYIARKAKVTVESDHKPLQAIFKKSILSAPSRLQKMLLRLQRYNLEVHYKPGKEMYIADHLSRAPTTSTESDRDAFEVFTVELDSSDPLEYIQVKPERLAHLQKCTGQDPVLQTLKETVLAGWPERREQAPEQIRDYWNYRDEITVHNGVLFKSNRVIIPRIMRPNTLSRIHSSHQGAESCLRKARDIVFWPGMSKDVKDVVEKCSVCADYQSGNPKQPMQTQKIPDRPWSRLSADIFTLKDKQYISLVDHYSDFIEVGELPDTTSETVIQFFKQQFSRHGIPDCVVTDNASQFVSREVHEFSLDWEFEHVTSSPLYPKSNGKAESSVKVAKNLFKKALKDGKDPWLALLDQRNTPTEGIGSSPAQRLMSRRTRGLLPTATTLLKPKVEENARDKIKLRKQKSKLTMTAQQRHYQN